MTSIDPEGETTIGWTHFVYPESKLLDALCVIAGYGFAEIIYFRDRAPGLHWKHISKFVVIALVVTMIVNQLLGLYGQRPRDTWADKARRLAFSGAIVLSVLATVYPLGRRLPFEQVPISVVIAGCVLATSGMGIVRMSLRLVAWILEQGHSGAAASPGHGVR
jgi:FlaA1/EpsC-like NDP-sugar epimerase